MCSVHKSSPATATDSERRWQFLITAFGVDPIPHSHRMIPMIMNFHLALLLPFPFNFFSFSMWLWVLETCSSHSKSFSAAFLPFHNHKSGNLKEWFVNFKSEKLPCRHVHRFAVTVKRRSNRVCIHGMTFSTAAPPIFSLSSGGKAPERHNRINMYELVY
jgi:hypothetical protein